MGKKNIDDQNEAVSSDQFDDRDAQADQAQDKAQARSTLKLKRY